MPPPVLRFAPSPNGYLHLGHAYSALLNFDLAARTGHRRGAQVQRECRDQRERDHDRPGMAGEATGQQHAERAQESPRDCPGQRGAQRESGDGDSPVTLAAPLTERGDARENRLASGRPRRAHGGDDGRGEPQPRDHSCEVPPG